MAKKKCNVGSSCGASCISQAKVCQKEFSGQVSQGLDKRVAGGVKTKEQFSMVQTPFAELDRKSAGPESWGQDDIYDGDYVVYKVENLPKAAVTGKLLRLGDEMEKEAVELMQSKWNGKIAEVSWDSEGGEEFPPEMRLQAALEAKKMWKEEILPNLEDGTLLFNRPVGGPHSVRDRLYRKGGFGRVQEKSEDQYAMVVNGKLVPVEFVPPNQAYLEDEKIPQEKRDNWDFASGGKVTAERVREVASGMGVELSEDELDLYLEEANEN